MRRALGSELWSGPIVIGSGRSLSVLDVVNAVREVTGASFDVEHGPPRAGEMPAVIVDPARAHAAGWSPAFSFEQGLAGVWGEWSKIDLDAVSAGVGAVGAVR
jgi:UDP-glucose 4-epimerase